MKRFGLFVGLLLLFFIFTAVGLQADTVVAAYDFEQNGNDSASALTASAVGSPSYVSMPAASSNSWRLDKCTDSKYFTLPTAVLPASMATAGTIEFRYFRGPEPFNSNDEEMMFHATYASGNQDTIDVLSTGACRIRMSTLGGNLEIDPPAGTIQFGRDYVWDISYSGTTLNFYLTDIGCGTTTLAGTGTNGSVFTVSAPSAVYVGSVQPLASNFYISGYLDALTFHTAALTSPSTYFPQKTPLLLLGHGASVTAGRLTGASCNTGYGDGHRRGFQNTAGAHGKAYYWVGRNTYGGIGYNNVTVESPYSEAVAGASTSAQVSIISASVAANFITPSANDVVLWGGDCTYNDAGFSVTTPTSLAFSELACESVTAWSSLPKFVYMTDDVSRSAGTTYSNQNQMILQECEDEHSKGRNVGWFDLNAYVNANGGWSRCDGVHPTDGVYDVIGQGLEAAAEAGFPMPTPTPGATTQFDRRRRR